MPRNAPASTAQAIVLQLTNVMWCRMRSMVCCDVVRGWMKSQTTFVSCFNFVGLMVSNCLMAAESEIWLISKVLIKITRETAPVFEKVVIGSNHFPCFNSKIFWEKWDRIELKVFHKQCMWRMLWKWKNPNQKPMSQHTLQIWFEEGFEKYVVVQCLPIPQLSGSAINIVWRLNLQLQCAWDSLTDQQVIKNAGTGQVWYHRLGKCVHWKTFLNTSAPCEHVKFQSFVAWS